MYRLQYSSSHPVIVDVFFEEFSADLELIILSSEPLLITGDFNIHVDVVGNPVSAKFLDLLEAMDLRQHVATPTHQSGHTLDLIITRQCDALVKDPPVSDYHISDHWSVYIIQLFPEGKVNSGGYIPRREASRYISTALHRP